MILVQGHAPAYARVTAAGNAKIPAHVVALLVAKVNAHSTALLNALMVVHIPVQQYVQVAAQILVLTLLKNQLNL